DAPFSSTRKKCSSSRDLRNNISRPGLVGTSLMLKINRDGSKFFLTNFLKSFTNTKSSTFPAKFTPYIDNPRVKGASEMTTTMSQVTEFNVPGGEPRSQKGLKIARYFSRAGADPYDEIEWEQRSASITNEKGKVVFEQNNVEIPK